MRNLLIFPVIIACLLSSGCSTTDESVHLTPVTQATISAYKNNPPVDNKLDAVILARISILGSRIIPVGEPQPVYAEQMSLEEAGQKINWDTPTFLPVNMIVWLVIFEGEWQFEFPMYENGVVPTLEPPYHGCQFSIVSANDGQHVTYGEVTCPSKIK